MLKKLKGRILISCAAAAGAAALLGGCRLPLPESYPPQVWTEGVDNITETRAVLSGSINPNGSATAGWFEWGSVPGFSSSQNTRSVAFGPGVTALEASARLYGLSPGTMYYYRITAKNRAGTSEGRTGTFTTLSPEEQPVVVNSLQDSAEPPAGAVTLRAALEAVNPGGVITFAPELNGATLELTVIGSTSSTLKGEVYQNGFEYLGFLPRNYGNSALYAKKNVVIDASALADGITLKWAGGDSAHARVLAVLGNLTLKNVSITAGSARAEPLDDESQPYSLGRGGGLAVWGHAILQNCSIYGNTAEGDEIPARDRGAFGGGIYADIVTMTDCQVSGNTVKGFGAAGGGLYSVGGADSFGQGSKITRCSLTGNRVSGQHAYGGGIYSDGGGRGKTRTLRLAGCTIARNLVEDNPAIAENDLSQYYYRGGGVYMSNGYLTASSCTIAENEVTGIAHLFKDRPNMAGGGIAATIGNAHVVENMQLQHSIIAGNTVAGEPDDVFTGSLLHFFSWGYNRIGRLDFSQILVPIPEWTSLSRKHWPKAGDIDAVAAGDVLQLGDIAFHPSILSAGTDAGDPAVRWYTPAGSAAGAIPAIPYRVSYILAQYSLRSGAEDDFLNQVIFKIRKNYSDVLGPDFGEDFGDLTGLTWYGPPVEWPKNPDNAPWIQFWHDLDDALGDSIGTVKLGDEFWGSFRSGALGDNVILLVLSRSYGPVRPPATDQRGAARRAGTKADIGAIQTSGL